MDMIHSFYALHPGRMVARFTNYN